METIIKALLLHAIAGPLFLIFIKRPPETMLKSFLVVFVCGPLAWVISVGVLVYVKSGGKNLNGLADKFDAL